MAASGFTRSSIKQMGLGRETQSVKIENMDYIKENLYEIKFELSNVDLLLGAKREDGKRR